MGIIIDITSPYLDEDKGHYIKRIKIIDPSFNMTKSINGLKFGYCTVTIFAKRPDELPNPKVLGDILYLRRYNNFYADSHSKNTTITSNPTHIKKTSVTGSSWMAPKMPKDLPTINHPD